jgi:hypothetical protein
VEVRHVNMVAANKQLDRFRRLRIPYRIADELQPSRALDRTVVKLVSDHVMSAVCEQICFRGKHLVFAARLSVAVVGNEYPH